MRHASRIAAAIEMMEQIHESWASGSRAPVDGMLASFFKARRYMGAKDRGAVAELVYYALRMGGSLEWWMERAQMQSSPRAVILLASLFLHDQNADELAQLCSGEKFAPAPLTSSERRLLEACEDEALIHDEMPDWARYNVLEWLIPKLKERFPEHLADEMLALNEQAPVDLRVNTLKCASRADLIMALDQLQIYAAPTPHSPLGVRLRERKPVFTTEAFKKGWFEMQDEASQIVAMLVEAQEGEKVIDFCAGAGGKTLAIAAQMHNKGRLLAWDINETRLYQIKKRLARAGVDNVLLQVLKSETDPYIKRHKETADWVLVDAPCSGSGTWRRNPDLKWRLSQQDVEETKALQRAILRSAARTVKPGGKLIYATCSLLPEENQHQIRDFLSENEDFLLEPLPEIWNKHRLWIDGMGAMLQTSPHQDGTDGFFAAIMQKKPLAA